MKNKKTILVYIATTLVIAMACNRGGKSSNGGSSAVVTPELPKVREIRNISLSDQYNKSVDTTDKKFFNITTGKYSNDVNSKIELAYVTIADLNNRHAIGCSKSSKIRSYHNSPVNNTSEVEFYDIKDGYSPFIYDTINYSASIDKVFNSTTNGNRNFTLATNLGDNNSVASDKFGWGVGQIIGFKIIASGKRGIIKLISPAPTSISVNGNAIKYGSIYMDIKMEQ